MLYGQYYGQYTFAVSGAHGSFGTMLVDQERNRMVSDSIESRLAVSGVVSYWTKFLSGNSNKNKVFGPILL